MAPVSTINEGALRFATMTYEVDRKLTPEDRLTLLMFFESVRSGSFIASISVAAIAGVGVAVACSTFLSPALSKKWTFKYAPPIMTGLVVSKLAHTPSELFFFDKNLDDLKNKSTNCYNAARIYRGFPIQDQIDYYRITVNHPEKCTTDPRKLKEGQFDEFINGLRDVRAKKGK